MDAEDAKVLERIAVALEQLVEIARASTGYGQSGPPVEGPAYDIVDEAELWEIEERARMRWEGYE